MSSKINDPRAHRRLANEIKVELRRASVQLSLLQHRVGTRVRMRDADLECLDLIDRYGPLTPSELARESGIHPATLTGVLDRLERDGWAVRERDPDDRRAVRVRALPDRAAEIFALFAPMNSSLDGICGNYTEAELEVLADFLRRVGEAGRAATEELKG